MTMRLVLNLRQVGSNTVHGSINTISSLGDMPEPAFATNSVLGNIGAPLGGIGDEDMVDEERAIDDVEQREVVDNLEERRIIADVEERRVVHDVEAGPSNMNVFGN
jgi:hypothetical protein